ncbi:HWE histidine kinase domain-containing protein [Paracoccus laeviglucosivorans]|uniref:histidine kinase n=1 Tax=Paracoccus laeviglucosivorans TaxID=1197861 RepID=A0A521BC69_9RHOB|nr:HWE histidine kinase domain-containing protein [Paracoccus laeviglucosivorans]SMO44667.1 Bacteriophytochrome (light-regulated signal transduction histidine kinase) [Paracoccus laeviglucosivorans]
MTRNSVSDASLAGQPIDLTNCDREPIHIPGSIQPHGCLLACDAAARVVLRHSANAMRMLGLTDDPNGKPLAEIIGADHVHTLVNALAVAGHEPRPALVFGLEVNGQSFDVTGHRYDGHAILEFEPASENLGAVMSMARTVVGRLRALDSAEAVIQQAAYLIQAKLGYDRVMIYELGPDGAGKVVSEAKLDVHESFRGQYFPASDIPQQARALYLRNPIRVISDASFEPVPVLPVQDERGAALDMSYAHLRSVSPVHCEYLRNMGVSASMSVSIIINGQLWGLIACHHYAPKVLSMADRAAAEMVGEFFSMHLDSLRRKHARKAEDLARRALDDLMVDASRSEDVNTALENRLPQLADLISAEGIALWFNGKWSKQGHAPSHEAAEPLLRLAEAAPDGQIFQTDQLSTLLPEATDLTRIAAGVLIIPLSQRPRDFLFYFRQEAEQTLDWAGDPNKTYETGPLGDRLTPRKSFAIWKETVRGKSHPWSEADHRFAEALRISVVEVLLFNSELLADERARAAVRQRVLNQELNHRVKNILAVIRTLVSQKHHDGETLHSYTSALRGRIQALANAHDQVIRDENGGLLRDLLQAELGPYSAKGDDIRLQGPAISLDSRAFSVMALILHEMATNAAKYGALSQRSGQLAITWSLLPGGDCTIRWQESHVTGVRIPDTTGFGSDLIKRSLPFDLGGESELAFQPDGVVAQFRLPARFLRALDGDASAAIPALKSDDAPRLSSLEGRRVLLVEDQILIAMSLEAELQDHGLEVVGVAPNVATALQMIQDHAPDLAVLDLNLRNETSIPAAQMLMARGTRFIFATGYGRDIDLPDEFADVPVVQKPYLVQDILKAFRDA